MFVISVANQKGGSGKTTTAVNLAACLAMKGCRTLLVDLDPQAQASAFLRIEDRSPKATVFDGILETRTQGVNADDLYVPITQRLTLMPSEGITADDEARLVAQPNRENRLNDLLAGAKGKYDFVVVDCPPTLGMLTRNALMASNAVLLTVETSFLALHGMGRMLNLVQEVRNHKALRVYALATMFDGRTSFSREVLEDMRGFFEEMMLDTVIRQNVRLKEAASHGEPIFTYSRSSRGAEDYRAMTDELLGRIITDIEDFKSLVPEYGPDNSATDH
ncbi:MAG: ParA family protein [Proteobacteria bacterium]|nr:ParA family protein [Pseudomonadota bacterium]